MALALLKKCLEASLMFWGYGEVDGSTLAIRSIECCLYQVLLNWFANTLLIGVEGDQALWLSAIAKAIDYYVADYILVVNLWIEVFGQLGEESELLKVGDELVDARSALIVVYILEQLLKHTCSGTRCWNEFDSTNLCLLVESLALGNLLFAELANTIATSCSTYNRE